MAAPPARREFDLILIGCTGDAGRAIALRLARSPTAPASLRCALAGRSLAKLSALREEMIEAGSRSVELIQVDATSTSDMVALTPRGSLVISAAGPYSKLGEQLVSACVNARTHYADITGEVQWVAEMRSKYGEMAERAGVCLCSFCGYDCIPTELSVHLCAHALARDDRLVRAVCVTSISGGGMPHGTILTVLGMCTLAGSLSMARGVAALLPSSERLPALCSLVRWASLPLAWSAEMGCFTLPHGMGLCTTAVAHASASRNGFGGLLFSDRQCVPGLDCSSARTLWGLLPGLAMVFGMLLGAGPLAFYFVLASLFPSVQDLAARLLSSYSYKGDLSAEVRVVTTGRAASGTTVRTQFVCDGDAGIWCTAKLACETALCMLERVGTLPSGFVTPGDLGDPLVAHLRRAGIHLSARVEA